MKRLLKILVTLSVILIPAAVAAPQIGASSDQDEATAVAHLALHARGADDTLANGEAALNAYLADHPDNDHARFALGLVQFLRSGERLFQFLYEHGAGDQQRNQLLTMGLMMRPVPLLYNPNPRPISNEDLRGEIGAWIDDLAKAERTLAMIDDANVKLRVLVGLIRMDLDGDGSATEEEQLWRFFAALNTGFNPTQEGAAEFDIAFDRGDVDWLRGYCHLCMAAGESILAHDTSQIFNHTAQLFFADPQTPYPFLRTFNVEPEAREFATITDLVALFHLMSFDVVDADAMRRAHAHLKASVALGKSMWEHYLAEADNDREWIPTPDQTDVAFPNASIDAETLGIWLASLEEADAMLDGRRLVRFWRGNGTRGINLKRVFLEPQRFDLVLWIQGAAAAPYLEEGDFTTPGTWESLDRAFEGRVFRNMFWLN